MDQSQSEQPYLSPKVVRRKKMHQSIDCSRNNISQEHSVGETSPKQQMEEASQRLRTIEMISTYRQKKI